MKSPRRFSAARQSSQSLLLYWLLLGSSICISSGQEEASSGSGDGCDMLPCQNSMDCMGSADNYTCICGPGFTGKTCSTNMDECASSPCGRMGTCKDRDNGYTCICELGYTGENCQTEINECDLAPCMNNGTCTDMVRSYGCTCVPSFKGKSCETDQCDLCDADATCDRIGEPPCMCNAGFLGYGETCVAMTEVVNPTKNVAAMNTTGALVGVATSTTIFGINGTSSSGPWVLLKSYENITSNISIKELNQPGIRIVRTCRLFIYSNNTSEPRCDPPVFSGTFERSSTIGELIDWMNQSSATGDDSIFNVSASEGISDVTFKLPSLSASNYSVWVVEHRRFAPICMDRVLESNSSVCRWNSMEVNMTERAASLRNLPPGQHELRLHAETRSPTRRRRRRRQVVQQSPYTAPIVINIPDSPAGPVRNLMVIAKTNDSLTVSWRPPVSFNGDRRPYTVILLTGVGDNLQNVSNGSELATFPMLESFASYVIKVVASSSGGDSIPVLLYAKTAEGFPGRVRSISITNATGTRTGDLLTQVQWQEPTRPRGIILWYEVQYSSGTSDNFMNETSKGNGTMVVLNLAYYTSYVIKVAAHTGVGRGPFANTSYMTPIGAPPAAGLVLGEVAETSVSVYITAADDANGPIQAYAILIARCAQSIADPSESVVTAYSFRNCLECSCPPYASHYGQLADIRSDATSGNQSTVVLGTATHCTSNDICNAQLSNNTNYTVVVRAYTSNFIGNRSLADFNTGLFTDRLLSFTTGKSGPRPREEEKPNAAVVVGSVIGVIVCIACLSAGGYWAATHTERGEFYGLRALNLFHRPSSQVYNLRSMSKPNKWLGSYSARQDSPEDARDVENGQDNAAFIPSPFLDHSKANGQSTSLPDELDDGKFSSPVDIDNFASYISSMSAHSDLGFSNNYELICSIGRMHTYSTSMSTMNRPKNRYSNIVAYDHSRVALEVQESALHTSYINANYIHGPDKRNAYIATQGPLPDTVNDFWRMVWEQESSTIIMVTNLEEKGRIKCHPYWPGEEDIVGNQRHALQFPIQGQEPLIVELVKEQAVQFGQVRSFFLKQGSKSLSVSQFHFVQWPDHGVPETPDALLQFVLGVRYMREKRGLQSAAPLIVHCSAGVGRTGTFIAVDTAVDLLQDRDNTSLDLLKITCSMRNQRVFMVQTEGQFVYIHKCVATLLSYVKEYEEASPDLSRPEIFSRILSETYKFS